MLIQYMNWTENVIIDVIGTVSYNYDFHTGILPQTKKEIVFQRLMEPYMPQLMQQESFNDLVSMVII